MLRYGILGFGAHAAKRLMPGFERASRSKAAGFWRRDPQKSAEVSLKYGLESFAEAEALCASPEVDAIFIASPDALHLEHTLLALGYKKPVLCEKPLGMNAEECRQMVHAAEKAGVPFGVAHIFRFEASVRRIKQLVTGGGLGRPFFARSEFHYIGAQSPRTWIADPQLACGGPVGDVGVHCIDALRFIFDDQVTAVSASAIHHAAPEIESAATMVLEFAGGAIASVSVSAIAEYQTPLSILLESGSLSAENAFTVDSPVELRSKPVGGPLKTETITNDDAYAHQVDAFSDWVEHKTPFPAMGVEGWRNQLVLDAAYRSIKTGKKEFVPLIND